MKLVFFSINATFPSNYSIIAFIDGYYAQVNGTFEVTDGGQVNWSNMTLVPAEPDDLTVVINFTDLDDASVTVNRTIRSESPVLRFSLDVNPEIGNSNGVVSTTELSSYLEFLSQTGPGFQLGEEESNGEPEDDEDMGGPDDFLSLPIEILLDGSTFDSYVTGSHNGTIDNIASTDASDTSSIYYNATFNITLDGKICNTIGHSFNITTEHNNTFNTTLTIIYNDFYNITGNASTVNVTLTNTTSNLSIIPGENDTSDDAFAYANITLELNQTSYSTPIIEVPTWNITDWWQFNKTGSGPLAEQTYTVVGKPLRRWDRMEYYMEDDTSRYLCYKLYESNDSYSGDNYVTINDLQWLSMQNDNIILSNDLDFPLYGGKTWDAITWWGEPASASIASTNTNKVTGNGEHSCVQITYTNQSGDLCGEQWYSPDLKFFVNRTQNVSGSANITWNLTEFSHGPFIESVTVGNITNESGLIECLYANLSINVTNFYDGPSSYMLDGCLFKENFNGPPEDIMWVFDNSDSLRNVVSSPNLIHVNISYDGGIINASGVDGPYSAQLEMRKDNFDGGNDGYWIDAVDYYSFEADYNHDDFISPAVTVVSSHAFGNGTEGAYTYLTLNTTLNSADGGTYRMHAGLDKIINHSGGWQDWRWITGTGTDDFTLEEDTNTNVSLNFPGQDIYDRGYEGPYYVHLQIEDVDTGSFVYQNEWYIGGEYNYDDFARPCVFFNKTWFSNYSYGTHDYLNSSTYLTLNTSITVSDVSGVGEYELCGGIHLGNLSNPDDYGQFITGTCNDQITLSLGDNLVPMNFDIGEIQDKLTNGELSNFQFKVDLGLSERVGDWIGPDIDHTTYFTQQYNLSDLPDPPINLIVYEDTNETENLTIKAYLNITSEEYRGRTYDLHGGVHYNDSGQWKFITGTGYQLNVGGSWENQTVYLNFSGNEIAGSGQNGPYQVFLGLEDWNTHEYILHREYFTDSYVISDFDMPDIQFNESNTTAELWGSENFSVNVSVIVNSAGTYHFGGGINYVEEMGDWDNWVFLDGFGREEYLNENKNLTFNFSQSIIRSALPNDYDGPLVIHVGIEDPSNWQPIAHLDYETTQSYSPSDFSPSSVVINSTYVFINDGDDLQLNISYDASDSVSGNNYNVFGGLHDDTWWYITGDWKGGVSLTPGNGNNLSLNFLGSDIFGSQINPTKIWFGIEKVEGYSYQMIANRELAISGFTYDQFSSSKDVSIIRDNMGDGNADYIHTVDSKPYLTVNLSINVTTGNSGTYWIDGGLDYVENDNYHFITGKGKQQYLSVGNHTIQLNFSATDIKNSGYFGSYNVWLSIRDPSNNWEDEDNYEYTTQQYSSSDFPAAPITIVDKTEGSTDIAYIDGDQFVVNVTINVSSGNDGEYDLHGGVNYKTNEGWWQHITGTGDWVDLKVGSNEETLVLNAGEIKNKLPSGSRNLSIWIGINDISDWEEITHNEYITKEYSQNDFPGPKMTITGNDDSVWGENYTVNLTLNASNDDYFNNLKIHGGLNYIDNSNGWDEWRFITGFHQEVSLSSNGTVSCNFSGGDIYTELESIEGSTRLIAWIAVENTSSWTELAHIEYESDQEYSSSDFSAPSLTLNCTGDFYNLTAQSLQVNVSINKSDGSFDDTTYEVHSGIHYVDDLHGWDEWRFITGFHRIITPTQNITIPLNFSGSAIYETGETGPFEIWVGISREGQWNDLAHDEYQTSTDYSTTEFARPDIIIVEENITDYVNGSRDLTINVTVVDPSEILSEPEGDFVLEGCLHWKDGHRWKWITWNETYFDRSTGEYNVTLNFDGGEIKKAQDDGWSEEELVAWFSVRNTTTWQELDRMDEYIIQGSYNPEDFSDPAILFNTANDPVTSTDGSDSSEWLNVTVNLTVNQQGTYQLYAGLFDSVNKTILVKTNATITSGDTNVTASFNGTKIYSREFNGSYEFRAKIVSNEKEYDRMKTLLGEYTYDQFQEGEPEGYIENNFSSYMNTTTGDFVVNITINGSVNGNFEIYGDLFNSNTSTWITSNSTNITHDFSGDTNNLTLGLRFNGTDIANSNQDGNYSLEYVRLSIDRDDSADEEWEELDFMKDAHVADYHTHDEFGG